MRWHYKRVDVDIGGVAEASFEQRLDRLGVEGWELVTAIQHARHGYSQEVHLLFKRPAANAGELAGE
ncbi:MAG: DUF4177 domain-containing protein [Labilithrix sp.]|nr:DUF4177 domain-containing protein [Labilithrix sp.]MBX3219359.1 DUF4177 domain-containing protein [Labilithrix sp.]